MTVAGIVQGDVQSAEKRRKANRGKRGAASDTAGGTGMSAPA